MHFRVYYQQYTIIKQHIFADVMYEQTYIENILQIDVDKL